MPTKSWDSGRVTIDAPADKAKPVASRRAHHNREAATKRGCAATAAARENARCPKQTQVWVPKQQSTPTRWQAGKRHDGQREWKTPRVEPQPDQGTTRFQSGWALKRQVCAPPHRRVCGNPRRQPAAQNGTTPPPATRGKRRPAVVQRSSGAKGSTPGAGAS